METRKTDVAIIGAGTAGLAARREAARAGASTLLIESGPYGTTCARVGCMPSKLLIAAADAAHEVSRAGIFGIELPEGARVRGPDVLARVRRERDRFAGFVVESVEDIPEDQRIRGHARFDGAASLVVEGGPRIDAGAVVIAAGSSPWLPPPLRAVADRVLTSDGVFELEDLPASVALFGTGVLGLELGQALQRLGVRASFFSPFAEVGPFTDPELREAARTLLGRELDLRLEVDYEVSLAEPEGFEVRYTADGASETAYFERLMAAAGRRPNLQGLELGKAGIPLDDDGLPRFDPATMQCGEQPVFVAGDVDALRPVLHEASDEGSIAGRNAASFPDVSRHRRRVPFSIAFTDPQMAMVGRRYADLDPGAIEIGTIDYSNQGRARVMARNAGLVRLYAERGSGRLLGAEMLGPSVEHTSHLLAWAAQRGLTVNECYELPFYHPVVEEGIRTALRDACYRLDLVCRSTPKDLEHGPGA